MGRAKDLLIDAWSAISYKTPLADEIEARRRGFMAPSWVPEDHRRRLAAYTILAAYEANMARSLLGGTDDDRDANREYGDAALIIDMVTAHLLGESQEIVVLGAEEAADLLSEAASNRSDEEDAEEDGEDGQAGQDPNVDLEEALELVARQEWLRDWARSVHMPLRIQDGERNAVTYGDGVYLLGWDIDRERPTMAVMDPGFYFPVLPDTLDAYAYPETVHFAWELPGDDFPDGKTRVRRITYRLGPLEDGVRFDEDTDEEILPEGTSRDARGRLVRQYPWGEADSPSTRTCYVTDATWKLDDVKGGTGWSSLSPDAAMYHLEETDSEVIEMRGYDLGIDFIPVVHVPNTTAGGQHYGQSSLSRVLQIIDDLQAADTDAQRASATAGSPIIGVSGTKIKAGDGGDLNVNAGEVWDLGTEGKLTTISTAAALAELRSYVEALRDRLSTNSRLPAAILGTIDPSDVPSGYAMQLSFGPLSAMIRSMRLMRSVKHPLLFKMVQRLAQANGALPPGPTPVAELRLGAFLPTDQAGTLKLVRDAVESGILSLPTAVKMLVDVGFPIEDIAEEVAVINSRDFKAANELADAVGDLQAVFDFLGIDRTAEEAVAPVILPGGVQAPPVPPTPPTSTS